MKQNLKIAKDLIKIAKQIVANNINLNVELRDFNGSTSYMILPYGEEGMDVTQIVAYLLKTEKELKKGFKEWGIGQYIGIYIHEGELGAFCRILNYNFAEDFILNIKPENPENVDNTQVKNYIQDTFKACFPNITIRISDDKVRDITNIIKKYYKKIVEKYPYSFNHK